MHNERKHTDTGTEQTDKHSKDLKTLMERSQDVRERVDCFISCKKFLFLQLISSQTCKILSYDNNFYFSKIQVRVILEMERYLTDITK